MAYAHAYEPSRVILLYPWSSDVCKEKGILCNWKISGEKKVPLDIATVDVSKSEQDHYTKNIENVLKEIVVSSG